VGGFSLFSKGKARGIYTFCKPFLQTIYPKGDTTISQATFGSSRTKKEPFPANVGAAFLFTGYVIEL